MEIIVFFYLILTVESVVNKQFKGRTGVLSPLEVYNSIESRVVNAKKTAYSLHRHNYYQQVE